MTQTQPFQPTPEQQQKALALLIEFDRLCDGAKKKANGDIPTMMEITKILQEIMAVKDDPLRSLDVLEAANEKLKMYQ